MKSACVHGGNLVAEQPHQHRTGDGEQARVVFVTLFEGLCHSL
jgi:hypothetical protein